MQQNARMKVSAKGIYFLPAFAAVMSKQKRSLKQFFFNDLNVRLFVPPVMKYIMIASYQGDFHLLKAGSPLPEPVQFYIGLAVKEIANNNESFRFEVMHEAN